MSIAKTQPEWPGPGQKDVVWKFDEPVTLYEYIIGVGSVTDHVEKRGLSLKFGPYAQYKRNVCISTRDRWYMNRSWPEWTWMVMVRGLHPLNRKDRVERHGGVTIHSGQEAMMIEEFEAWLIRERLEILVDFREAAIADGWEPPYAGCACNPPSLPPDHLAHWYPDRTMLTCSPTREQWTEARLSYYEDHDCQDFPLETKPSDLLGIEGFWNLINQLEWRYRDLGRDLRQAKKQFPHLFQRKGETHGQWASRYFTLPEEERDQQEKLDTTETRRQIFRAIKILKTEGIPTYGQDGGFLEELKPLQTLRDEAVERWRKQLRAKSAIDFPIDDAAWEIEIAERTAKEAERQARLQVVLKAGA